MNGGVPSSSAGRQYDVANESDVISLLQAVRHSTLDDASKDVVRDLIFDLRTNLDPAQLEELQMYIKPVNLLIKGAQTEQVAPAASEPVTPATPTHSGFSGARPTPQFTPSSVAPTPTPTPAPATTPEPTPATPAASEPVAPASAPAPVENAPEVTTEPVPAEPAAISTETPKPEQQSDVPAAPVTPAENPDATARIAEIKRTVNQAVGNPVNLIDATNEVGREYMNALLEAMKATQGGGDSAAAMQRLETAFTAVQETLKNGTTVSATSEPKPEAEPTPTPEPSVQEPVTAPEPTTPPEPTTEPVAPASVPEASPDPVMPEVEPAASAAAASPLQSVAATQSITAENPIEEAPTPDTSGDPLMSETVTQGLQQLLGEWKLFKAGGLLGTGAKGMQHPLYVEMKNLPMSLVIAGRFEGATPEVKQSIHDYMNGWRYEQGMTHDLKETFEQYLRRVVKTIIDKQAKAE